MAERCQGVEALITKEGELKNILKIANLQILVF